MTIYLIRHGKTLANEQHLYCGSSDLPLSDGGKESLTGLNYQISDAKFLTSGMLRTEQTLKILFGNVAHDVEPGFREVDFGAFELQSYDQLKDTPAYQQWLSGDNETNVPPGGESGAQMKLRVLDALSRIQEDTVVITHGGVIAAVMAHCFPQENKSRYEWQPKCGEGYAISGNVYWKIP
jgi:alpha-ribazole phosphatase